MSNHLHLALLDGRGELSSWASYFLGNLARAVNRIRGRRGPFFERRYSAEPILDVEALHDRVVYVATNPVKAGLCKRVSEWPGVALVARDRRPVQTTISWFDRHLRCSGALTVHPVPAIDSVGSSSICTAIKSRERTLALERSRTGRRALTRSRVLSQSWRAAPRSPERSPRPLCHASDPRLRRWYRESARAFADAFREASQLLRDGAMRVAFPEWSFPPGGQLVRPSTPAPSPLSS
jgi:hypothetical protein